MSENRNMLSEETISLELILAVLQDILHQWRIILCVTLMAGMFSYVITDLTYVPEYKTTTTFVASVGGTSTTTYQNLSAASNLASVFTEVLNSSVFLNEVKEKVNVMSFDGVIKATPVAETNLLTMTVTGSDARTVFLMSKAVIQYHDIVSKEVLGSTILEVLHDPVVPTAVSNPTSMTRTVIKAMILTGGALCGLFGVMSLLKDKVRSRSEAESKLQTSVLAELFHEKKKKTWKDRLSRKKSSILITSPFTSFIYTEAIHKLSSRILKRLHTGEKVLLISSLLENEGKSTVAVNLGLSFAKKGKRVLLIDCDLRKPSCALILSMKETAGSVMSVLSGKASLQDCVQKVPNSSMELLAAYKGLRTATNLVASKSMSELLKQAKELYDVVIVDTPPMSLAPDTEVLLEYCDAAMIVVRQNEAHTDALNDAISVMENNAHLLGCVLNNMIGSGGFAPAFTYGSYGRYGKYGKYGKYGRYGYGRYGYGNYGVRSEESGDDDHE